MYRDFGPILEQPEIKVGLRSKIPKLQNVLIFYRFLELTLALKIQFAWGNY
jgi:hypothetical protein